MIPIVHTYKSREPMLQVNAFAIETTEGVIAIDTTLTMSDSISFRNMIESFNKPLLGIILTHGHPDHVAGTTNLVENRDVPVIALNAVHALMKDTEAKKHEQWSPVFGTEWIPRWVYPNQLVKDGDIIRLGDATLSVIDLGAGGDCDANSIWLLEGTPHAFLGDFIYNQNHTYMADGNILRWIANLERFESLLKGFESFHVGHGPVCNFGAIAKQKEYLLNYCATLLKHTGGTGIFNDETRVLFEKEMLSAYPGYGCQFMIGLAAEKVGTELKMKDI